MNEHSQEVRLRALDALVRSAKDSRAALAGFREVSLQMRRWSDDLTRHLDTLRKLCAEAIIHESLHRSMERKRGLLSHAAAQQPAMLKLCLEKLGTRESESRRQRSNRLTQTRYTLEQLRSLGLMAIVLARSAMIEAMSAQVAERVILAQIAQEFGEHARAVFTLGKELGPLLARAA